MSRASVLSALLDGVVAVAARVDCDLQPGSLARLHVADADPAAAQEVVARLRIALAAVDRDAPRARVEVRRLSGDAPATAPPALARPSPSLDLATGLALLALEEQVAPPAGLAAVGRLGPGSSVQPVRGVLVMAEAARAAGATAILVPRDCAAEAALVEDLVVHPVDHFAQVLAALRGEASLPAHERGGDSPASPTPEELDVRGQDAAILAVADAVADGRGVLLVGPGGTCKPVLARQALALLPSLRRDQALEVTRLHSVAGLAQELVAQRPFCAPPSSTPRAALVGDERRLGEVQLARHGVLYLADVVDFPPASLEAVASAVAAVPAEARPVVVADTSPCVCGVRDPGRTCRCRESDVADRARCAERARAILGLVRVETVYVYAESRWSDLPPGPSSADLRERVARRRASRVAEDTAEVPTVTIQISDPAGT